MRLGYNTNGFAHHRFEDAIPIIAEIGYESVAITLDHHTLNPFTADFDSRLTEARELLQRYRLHSVVETGARYLLDSRRKHYPTLVSRQSDERDRRVEFLCRAVDIAAALGSEAVSFWSGSLPDTVSREAAMERLVAGCSRVLEYAARKNVRLAFEPEPGMLVARMSDFATLARHFDHPHFGLTLDIGHVHCLDDGSIVDVLGAWSNRLFNIHLEDMRRGVHEHLMFGEGEIDFAPVFTVLRAIGYRGGVHVELSRHSHDAVEVARRAYAFLSAL